MKFTTKNIFCLLACIFASTATTQGNSTVSASGSSGTVPHLETEELTPDEISERFRSMLECNKSLDKAAITRMKEETERIILAKTKDAGVKLLTKIIKRDGKSYLTIVSLDAADPLNCILYAGDAETKPSIKFVLDEAYAPKGTR